MNALAIFGLGVPELLIILAVVLLLFGGTRLAGLGKSSGRALREFKEETKDLKQKETPKPGAADPTDPYDSPPAITGGPVAQTPDYRQPSQETSSGAIDPEPRRDA